MPRPNRGAYLKFVRARGVYYVQWSEGGRTLKRSTGTADREEAEGQLAEFIRERQRGQQAVGPRDPRQFSVAEALDFYGSDHAPRTASPARIGYAIDALLPFWAEKSVGEISEASCRAYERWRRRSAGTVRRELGVLSAAVNFAHRHGKITATRFVFRPDKPEGRSRWLSREEAGRLMAAARKSRKDSRTYLPLFIALALYTGARKEAILSLRWPQVDFKRGQIDFNPPGRKRTSKGRSVVRIARPLMAHLRLARRYGSELGYVLHRNGERIGDLKRSFAKVCEKAGLEGVTPHTLRHTCGTWLAQAGVDLWEVAGWLGQTNARTTELYAHHHPDHMVSAMRALDRMRA